MNQAILFEKLLKNFQKIPPFQAPPPTFMEVAGFPHYENVCSNILAFYFDPTQPHGFGDLMLKALLSALGEAELTNEMGVVTNIQREEPTEDGKRIDLVITTDNAVIAIENKIYAGVYNDLDCYSAHVERKYSSCQIKKKLVLSLHSIDNQLAGGFVNVIYENLIACLAKFLGEYAIKADTKYLTHLIDFVETLKRLKRMINVDPEVLNFFKNNREQIEDLLDADKQIKNLIWEKVTQLRASLETPPPHVRQWIYHKDDLVHDFTLGNVVVAVDTSIQLDGISIVIWVRKGNVNNKEFLSSLSFFQSNNMKLENWEDDKYRAVFKKDMPFETPVEALRNVLQDILKEIYVVEN